MNRYTNFFEGQNMKFRMLAVAAAMAVSAGAHAAVFSDNFDADAQGTDSTPTNWYLGADTNDVDIIGTGFFDVIPGNGNYVDLDGSNGKSPAGVLATDIAVILGGVYTATFQLGGNHRDGTTDSVTVMFGGTTLVLPVSPTDAFTTYSISTTATSGSLTLSFADDRSGNIGALLDNVSVSAVPEPGSLSLMLAGFAALGFAARRRRGN
jgi:hypothetical protein